MNMAKLLWDAAGRTQKSALPILSFPAIQKMGLTVRQLVHSSEYQAQAMKVVAQAFPAIAAVSLMDLSVEAEAFGASAQFSDHEVPTIVGQLISSAEDTQALKVPSIGAGRTGLCVEAICLAKQAITDRPVLAGVIGPYSLAGRLCDVTEIMYLCYDEPELVHTVLQKAVDFLIEYCKAFRDAGADGIIMAEPLAGLLSPEMCATFSIPYVRQIIQAVQREDFVVIYHNCGNAVMQMLDGIFSQGAIGYHFGNSADMRRVLDVAPKTALCMGNIDPAGEFMCGTPQSIAEATRQLLDACGAETNFLLSSGCDIPPHANWDNIHAFFETLDRYGRDNALVHAALEVGAQKAVVIPQEQIVLSDSFRKICEGNGCGSYGRCWMCPPDVGEINALMEQVRHYPYGLLYQTIGYIEDSFDIEGMSRCGTAHAQVSQRVHAALTPLLSSKVLHLSCGGCRLCGHCAKCDNLPCRHPHLALASLESYGVDVYRTTKDTHLKYINGQNTVTFFGMILFGA